MLRLMSLMSLGLLVLIGAGKATVGQPAPGFELTDLSGNKIALSDFKSKTVVLEWINPQCPFVHRQYKFGTMQKLIDKYPDVVWLRIATGSSANPARLKAFAGEHKMTGEILLDPTGQVGQAYGATNTPDMYIIDPAGILVYAGAIDSQPTADPDEKIHSNTINYVGQALNELQKNQPIAHPMTKPYGCWIKYPD